MTREGKEVTRRRFIRREFERLNGVCPFCKCQMTLNRERKNSATFDHIVSKHDGGSNALANGQIMCSECNSKKGSHSNESFLKNRVWEMKRGHPTFDLFKMQRYASKTGNVKCLRAMGRYCCEQG